jgi:hypothetical protein
LPPVIPGRPLKGFVMLVVGGPPFVKDAPVSRLVAATL